MKVYSRAVAERLLRDPNHKFDGLISIFTPPHSPFTFKGADTTPCAGFDSFDGPKLALGFDDVEHLFTQGIAVTPLQIQEVLNFALKCNNPLIHCQAGVSRSTAIATCFMLEKAPPAARDEKLKTMVLGWIYGNNPWAHPNTLVLSQYEALTQQAPFLPTASDNMFREFNS